jgi:hypothetical protein
VLSTGHERIIDVNVIAKPPGSFRSREMTSGCGRGDLMNCAMSNKLREEGDICHRPGEDTGSSLLPANAQQINSVILKLAEFRSPLLVTHKSLSRRDFEARKSFRSGNDEMCQTGYIIVVHVLQRMWKREMHRTQTTNRSLPAPGPIASASDNISGRGS